uniref:Uncharacterized protein n=1 Tax=Vespula pensylvanica TaxID=30213 RepID=A0A834UH13_VESPE|nr:hypothetical protein H0235_001717 [Vespula pensylvanica]
MRDYLSRCAFVSRLSAEPVNRENNPSQFADHRGVPYTGGLRKGERWRRRDRCGSGTRRKQISVNNEDTTP